MLKWEPFWELNEEALDWSADKWTTYWFHARDHNIWGVKTINFRNALFIYLHARYYNCKWVTSVWGELYLAVDYKTCSCAFCNITSTLRTMTLRNVGTHTSWLLCTSAVENSSARCHHGRRIELLLDNRQNPIVQYQTAGKTHHHAWINMDKNNVCSICLLFHSNIALETISEGIFLGSMPLDSHSWCA